MLIVAKALCLCRSNRRPRPFWKETTKCQSSPAKMSASSATSPAKSSNSPPATSTRGAASAGATSTSVARPIAPRCGVGSRWRGGRCCRRIRCSAPIPPAGTSSIRYGRSSTRTGWATTRSSSRGGEWASPGIATRRTPGAWRRRRWTARTWAGFGTNTRSRPRRTTSASPCPRSRTTPKRRSGRCRA